MATTKQYNDLQDGGNIQTGDKLAVARAGASELLTVPAESLAQRAAEIVSTDQMQEFVADIGLGKQVLAQALNNKGAGVTAADTLAQMAEKVDALDVVGAKEYVASKWQFLTTAQKLGVDSPDVDGYSTVLQYKDLVLTVNCTTKTITTRRIVGGNTGWTELDFLEEPDLLESVGLVVPNKDHSYVAILTHGSSLVKILVYQIGDDGVLSKRGTTISTAYTAVPSARNYCSMFLSPSGKSVFLQLASTVGKPMYKYDVDSSEENILMLSSSIANIGFSTMPTEETLIGIDSTDQYTIIYKGTISGDNVSVSSFSLSGASSSAIVPLTKDDLLISWSPENLNTYSGTYRKLRLYDLTNGNLIKEKQTRYKYFSNSSSSPSFYTQYSLFSFRFESGVYSLFDGYNGVAKYIVETGELKLNDNSETIILGRTLSSILVLDYKANINYNGYSAGANNVYVSASKLMIGHKSPLSLQPSKWTSLVACSFKDDTPVVGVIYKRNGNETLLFIDFFDEDAYAAGAYDLENSSAVVQLSGEADQ